MKLCPCGSKTPYIKCCKQFITGKAYPETAEQLMRSRYSAYTRGRTDYIAATQAGVEDYDVSASKAWADAIKWLRLEVLEKTGGEKDDKTGTVKFVAYFIEDAKANTIAENSQFEKVDGKWIYEQKKTSN